MISIPSYHLSSRLRCAIAPCGAAAAVLWDKVIPIIIVFLAIAVLIAIAVRLSGTAK